MIEEGTHCGWVDCPCMHTEGCERGWIWKEYYDNKYVTNKDGTKTKQSIRREGVIPCQICDSERYEIYLSSKSSFEYHQKLQARSKAKKAKQYEESELSKTRTL